MTKRPQRSKPAHARPARAEHKPAFRLDERKKRFLIAGVILVLAGVPFILGKYFEFNSPLAFDGGAYLYSARHVLEGARIGFEERPSAQAGTLLMNMLAVKLWGFSDIGPKVLQMLFQAGALVFLFVTTRRLFGTLAGAIGVIVASVYLSAPLIAKYGNVKEQFMIAFMVMGICCFVFYRLTGKWWWLLLTGAMLVWGPMFKQTGLSAIAAVGLFVLVQPLLHRDPWKRAVRDLLLMTGGAVAVLVPIIGWYVSMGSPVQFWPYSFVYAPLLPAATPADAQATEPNTVHAELEVAQTEKPPTSFVLRFLPGYVRDSWEALGPAARKQAFLRVLRYYKLLILPILLALGAIVARLVVWLRDRPKTKKPPVQDDPGRFVLLFAVWWFFDMAFIWISPRSYEQYYLPLNASAAMLGGYLLYLYSRRLHHDANRARWVVLGLLSVLLMMILSWHIFFGIKKSPHSGTAYDTPSRGYLQKCKEVAARHTPPRAGRIPATPLYTAWRSVEESQQGNRGAWEQVGQYIREHTDPNDTIYVWGWVPGIYVQAQRLSSASKAFEGTMHTLPPAELARRVRELLDAFKKDPPEFIVDTRKVHFPWDRPPLELWPLVRQQFLPLDPTTIQQYETAYAQQLAQAIEPDEAARFKAMKPFRDYVMQNYRIVGLFGEQVLFQRKP